jgi:RND family efflux transporter MFP subunit
MSELPVPPAQQRSGALQPSRRYIVIAIALAVLLAVWGILSRLHARNALERQAQQAAIPTVATTRPKAGPASDHLVLPGNVQAYFEAPIYARTNGYLRMWYTDIGAAVKQGQLLAQIDAPDLDQQLRQAQADLATAQANYLLARITNERWQGLLKTQSVSQQDADQRAGDAAAKLAAQQSAAANVQRLLDLESFKRVVAPFAGVVTQRNTDVGALINAGESPGNALFRVSDTHRLRIYVFVPQAYAAEIRAGLDATLEFTDHPGQHYTATVASTAHALDAVSRTLQVELQIDNTGGELLPGSYVQVTFTLPSHANTLRVPANAVIFRTGNLQVATLDAAQRVHLKNITEGRDFGTEIEVLGGLSPDDTLIVSPPDSVANGMQVRVQQPPSNPARRQPGAHGGAAAEHSS